jgi:hypothetical protein
MAWQVRISGLESSFHLQGVKGGEQKMAWYDPGLEFTPAHNREEIERDVIGIALLNSRF